MTIATKESANLAPAVRVRWWLLALGVIPLISTALLAGRLVWEQTVWTWERGPQMVGFSLAHGSSAVLLLAPFLLAFWAAIALMVIVTNLVKKRRTDTPTRAAFGLAVLLFGLLFVPSGVWQRLFIRQMTSSPRAGDLLVYAAYDRDFRTVKAMLSHGVSIEIEILKFPDIGFPGQHRGNAESMFKARGRWVTFARQLLSSLESIKADMGCEGYERAWRHPFPIEAYEKLRNAIQREKQLLRS